MKESIFGPKFEEALRAAGTDGLSAGDLYEAVGSSRQAVYTWIRKNEKHLRRVGESARGGVVYQWVDRTPAPRGSAAVDSDAVEVGSVFTVSRLRYVNGRMVATLTGSSTEVEAELS